MYSVLGAFSLKHKALNFVDYSTGGGGAGGGSLLCLCFAARCARALPPGLVARERWLAVHLQSIGHFPCLQPTPSSKSNNYNRQLHAVMDPGTRTGVVESSSVRRLHGGNLSPSLDMKMVNAGSWEWGKVCVCNKLDYLSINDINQLQLS